MARQSSSRRFSAHTQASSVESCSTFTQATRRPSKSICSLLVEESLRCSSPPCHLPRNAPQKSLTPKLHLRVEGAFPKPGVATHETRDRATCILLDPCRRS